MLNRIELGYKPRAQFTSYHHRAQRWACVVSHVRAGKTVACIMDLVDAALRCQLREPRFAYVAPYYAQAKDVAWNYLKRFTLDIPGAQAHEQELRVDFPNGGRVRLYGADNYNRMRGIYLDGVVLDEFADFHPAAWQEVIRQRLSDRSGWATFIGTPKGRNAFYDKWVEANADRDNWFSMMLRASETQILSESELADARKAMTPEQFDQEYECSFDAAIMGAYYGREMAKLDQAKRIRSVPYDPQLPVYTAWDLGIHDATAIWFVQCAGSEVRVIDYFETNGTGLNDVARILKNEKPYMYAEHYLPHDAEAPEMMTAKSRKEHLESLNIKPIVVVPQQRIEDGVNAVRNLLPRCVFDAQLCAQGIEALKQYRHEWDDKLKTFRTRPLHDWTSHSADAFRYLATSLAPKIERTSGRRSARIGHLVT